ncbi:F0F1 ATP synthase subunit delta [Solicola gregarius]|uniref:ATP synthase subunit delta n=1 Tax=Solicola gregarius TaxID=2908642 RepID=A0AA46YLY5_9ACTN|nr:F0F1 ATP synthase subunit delta [Solicola gregarius]UYM05981.1 F0F1 ATP synthase subunit delta [Solicola gregarius]
MRGVSAKSLIPVLEAVDQQVAGGADAHVLGDELFEVVALFDAEPRLRRTLTDPSTETAAQEGLVRQILGDRLDASTLDVVGAAVRGRWSAARDLADGLEQAGVTAHVAGADKAGRLDEVEDELFRFGRVVAGDAALRSALTDRGVQAGPKRTLVGNLLSEKASAATVALARQASVARAKGFEATLDEFAEIAASRRNRLVATARVAAPLSDDEKTRLAAALGRKYGRDVHVNVVIDASVVGGVSVEVGEDIIDGTVASRLEDARRRIAG